VRMISSKNGFPKTITRSWCGIFVSMSVSVSAGNRGGSVPELPSECTGDARHGRGVHAHREAVRGTVGGGFRWGMRSWPQPGSGKIAMNALYMADFHIWRPTSLTKLYVQLSARKINRCQTSQRQILGGFTNGGDLRRQAAIGGCALPWALK
jgi:hypothetical protein